MTTEEGPRKPPGGMLGHRGDPPDPLADKARRLVAGHHGPAMVVDCEGMPIAANNRGAELRSSLFAPDVPSLGKLLRRAVNDGTAVSGEIRSAENDVGQLLDISVIPVFDGKAVLLLARDLTLERNLRAALAESRQRYKDLVEISSEFSWEVGAEGSFTFISPRGALGHSAKELIGTKPDALVRHAEDFSPLPFACRQPMENIEVWLRCANGSDACMLVSSLPLRSATGIIVGARGVCRDVTGDRLREAALMRVQHRERMINYVTGTIRDKIDPLDMLSAAAGAAARALGAAGCRIFRRNQAEAYATAAAFGETEGTDALESYLLGQEERAESSVEMDIGRWRALAAATHHRQTVNGAVVVWKLAELGSWSEDDSVLLADIAGQLGIANEQINNHERMLELSRSDGMTGLLNRRAFVGDDLPRRMSRLRRDGRTAALFYIDMDNFKAVNDVHGHQRGDEALLALRDLLIEHSRPRDVIARLGGDEFAMWLDGISADVARQRAQALLAAAQALAVYSGSADRPLGISVGVALYEPASAESLDDLMARADSAMYAAKRRGKGSFEIAPPRGLINTPAMNLGIRP